MELDDTLAEAHGVLAGHKYWYEWDWAGAETEFRRAIELDPNYADARVFYSRFLSAMRRPEEAIAEIGRALELDPFSYLFQYVHGLDLLDASRYDDAIAQFRKTLGTLCAYDDETPGLVEIEDVKELVETIISDSWSFPALRP